MFIRGAPWVSDPRPGRAAVRVGHYQLQACQKPPPPQAGTRPLQRTLAPGRAGPLPAQGIASQALAKVTSFRRRRGIAPPPAQGPRPGRAAVRVGHYQLQACQKPHSAAGGDYPPTDVGPGWEAPPQRTLPQRTLPTTKKSGVLVKVTPLFILINHKGQIIILYFHQHFVVIGQLARNNFAGQRGFKVLL